MKPKKKNPSPTRRAIKPAWATPLFRELTELLPDAVIITGKDGKILASNSEAGRMFGYGKGELAGRMIEELVPKDLRKIHVGHRDEFARKPRIRAMGGGLKLVALRRDGTIFPVEIALSPLQGPHSRAVMSIIRDITERIGREEELHESELRYRSLVELSPEATLVHVDGTILYANQTAVELLGFKRREDLLGRYLVDFVPDEYREEVKERIRRLSPIGTKLPPLVLRARRPDGSEVVLESVASRAPYKGSVATQVMLRDVTERERSRAELLASRQQLRDLSTYLQRAREEERTAVAREIHDELGQALTALKMDLSGIADALQHDERDSRRSSIDARITAMSSVIDTTIKSVRRISTELRPVLLDSLGLGAAIEWQAEEFSSRTGIPCRISVVPEDLTVDGERSTALFRIFQELLTNITRHAGAKQVNARLEQRPGALVLEVRDDGKGISEEDMRKSKSFGFVGIRERSLLFGGSVSVEGSSGGGTRVTVTIPSEAHP